MSIDRKRLAFSTLGCPDWSFERILSEAAGLGFGAIELRGIGADIEIDSLPLLTKENRGYVRRALDEAGVGLCALDCSASFDDQTRQERSLSEGRYAIEAASELEAPFIRIFGDRIGGGEDIALVRTAGGIRRLCLEARGSGVTVLLETHGDFNTAERLYRTAELVDCPEFGILWDIEHTGRAGENARDFARRLLPLIKHVHLKDIDGSGRLCLPGDGALDIAGTAAMLDELSYSGLYSLEWEKRWHRELPEPETAFARYADIMTAD